MTTYPVHPETGVDGAKGLIAEYPVKCFALLARRNRWEGGAVR